MSLIPHQIAVCQLWGAVREPLKAGMTFTLVLFHCCSTNAVILTCLVSLFLSLFWYVWVAKAEHDMSMLCSLFCWQVVITESVQYQLHAILQIGRRLNDQESCLCASISSDPFFFLREFPQDPVSMNFDMLSAGGHSLCAPFCWCK